MNLIFSFTVSQIHEVFKNKNKGDDYKKQIYTDDISYWYAKKKYNHPNKFVFVGRKAHTIFQQDIMLR